MIYQRFSVLSLVFFLLCNLSTYAEENFILINGKTNKTIVEIGSKLHERVSPCSTFKIPLCLIGFDSEILKSGKAPIWEYQDGYDDFLQEWQTSQTPQSWIKCSCVWFSKILVTILGTKNFQYYLAIFDYGNQDISAGLTSSWIFSSLKISPIEQVEFLQNFVSGKLSITYEAVQKTKNLLYIETLDNGLKLFGKTGGGSYQLNGTHCQLAWFVGWIEDEDLQTFYPFAYNIQGSDLNFSQRIPRVKQLIEQLQL